MGDTYRDPIDHHRTTLPHAGATLKDDLMIPGLLLLAVSVVGVAVGLASAGYMHPQWAAVTVIVAIPVGAVGALALMIERRRIRRIESRWKVLRRP